MRMIVYGKGDYYWPDLELQINVIVHQKIY